MRSEDAVYDGSLNIADQNQERVGRLAFEFVQALRREAGANDPDSSNKLTPVEIFQQSIVHVPGFASALVAALNDDSGLGDDILEVTHILVNQLGVVNG